MRRILLATLVLTLTACDHFVGEALAPGTVCRQDAQAVIDTVGWYGVTETGEKVGPITTCRVRR